MYSCTAPAYKFIQKKKESNSLGDGLNFFVARHGFESFQETEGVEAVEQKPVLTHRSGGSKVPNMSKHRANTTLVSSSLLIKLIANNRTASTMSSPTPETSPESSDFESILESAFKQALSEYKKKTGKDLLDHPLAADVQRCNSVDEILVIFQGQAKAFQEFRDEDQRLMKWISPVVTVLHKLSKTAGDVTGTVRPRFPTTTI